MRIGVYAWALVWMFAFACASPRSNDRTGDLPSAGSTPGSAGTNAQSGSQSTGGVAASGTGGTLSSPGSDAASDPDPPDSRDGSIAPTDAAVTDASASLDAASNLLDRYPTRALTGPSYQGSLDNSADCSTTYPTAGFEPDTLPGTRYPLFLYFVGTVFVPDDASARYDSPAPMAVTEAMARRGFVALSVAYDNGAIAWISDHQSQLACLFDAASASSLIAASCALPQVDCALGIATWGHSQGGYVAAAAHNLEPRVSAVWATGYGGDASETIARERLRVVNGEADTTNGEASTLEMITGLSAAECPDPDQCLRADGSGWIIVRKADLALPDSSSADHCWFDRQSCTASEIMLEPNWIDPRSDKAFALEANADWIATTALR